MVDRCPAGGRGRQGAPRSARQNGAATAELAVAMPAVMVVLAAVLSVGQAVLAKVTCVDAARAGARAAARGAGLDQVREQALAVVPRGRQGETGGEHAVSISEAGAPGTAADLVARCAPQEAARASTMQAAPSKSAVIKARSSQVPSHPGM